MKFTNISSGLIACLFLCFGGTVQAQNVEAKPNIDRSKKIATLTVQASGTASPVFTGKLSESSSENWDVTIANYGQVFNHESETKESVIAAEKAALNQAKLDNPMIPSAEKNSNNTPIAVGRSFDGTFQTGFPPDNHTAISDDGYVVTVVNSRMSYYTEDGDIISSNNAFTDVFADLNLNSFYFDPKVLYDPEAERFILVVLSGSNSNTSNVVVAFSQTTNPADGWNAYAFEGNVLGTNAWFDFPSIGISNEDIFVSGNLFSNSSGFDQVIIFQIDKDAGFAGEDVEWEVFGTDEDNIFGGAFTVKPISHGFDAGYGPGIFMVSTSSFSGGTAYLYDVTGDVQDNQEIDVFPVSIPAFSVPGDGLQLGDSKLVGTGDARVQTGFFANGIVHFAHTVNATAGYAGIRYYRMDVGALTTTSTTINEVGSDFGFPAVAPFTLDETDPTVAIAILRTNQTIYPEVRALTVDENMDESDPILVRVGESPITVLDQNVQRWGDYTGITRRHNSAEPSVYLFACYGRNESYGNWVAELVGGNANAQAPTVDFEADITEGIVPLTVNFTDLSGNDPFLWHWEIEGEGTEQEQNPTVTFGAPGLYNVKLTVANEAGEAIENKVDYINVLPAGIPPSADFTSDVTMGPAPLTVNFEDASADEPSTWQWILSGANPAVSNEQNPTAIYNAPGTYKVRLIAGNGFGNDTEEKEGYITVTDPSSTSEVSSLSATKVFPNPTVERVTVEFFLDQTQLLDLALVDQQGRLVKQLARDRVKSGNNALSFNVQTLASGTYFLVISNENGEVLQTEAVQVY